VGEGGVVGEVVQGDKLDFGVVKTRAHNVPANAAEAVDCYFHCHVI
jgi:hypothetical protein